MSLSATILGCEGLVLTREERAFFADARPAGFILFARNVETPDQIRKLCEDLREAAGHDAPILIDQEGGRVARLRAPTWREFLPPLEQIVRAGEGAERSMYLRGRLIAADLYALGIDVNCAPCCDVARAITHPFLRNRCYGEDAASVTRMARALMQGQSDGGVLSVIKHIPGHGAGQVDSHLELPSTDLSLPELGAIDFAPFRALGDAPFAMTAHMIYGALDAAAPATTSGRVIRAIREDMGFEGALMSDDISMQALDGPVDVRARAAMAAGCDLVLHCNGEMPEMEAVVTASGPLQEAGARRMRAALAQRQVPRPVDIATLAEELEALLVKEPDG